MGFVLDASAGVELLLRTGRGDSIRSQVGVGADLWVPEHYFLEVSSTLRRMERNGLPPSRVSAAIRRLQGDAYTRAPLRPFLVAAWVRRGHLTIGDAFYVALAEAIGATLVTADLRLAKAPGLPVPVLTP